MRVLLPIIALALVGFALGDLSLDEYTSDWAVHLVPGVKPSFLEKHGFEVKGKVTGLDGIFLVRHREMHARSATRFSPSHDVTQFLDSMESVKWSEQQRLQKYTSQITFPDPLFGNQWHLINTGQFGGVAGVDAGVQGAWDLGYSGNGVRIAIVDDGFQYTHPDLSPGYQAASSANYNSGNPTDPAPTSATDGHGTCCGGVALARNNSACGVGAAFMAQGSGIRLIAESITDVQQANALSTTTQLNHIYSCSYGPAYLFLQNSPLGTTATRAVQNNVITGRGGLGSIYVFASGNSFLDGGDCNQGMTTNVNLITVGAVTNTGVRASYSNGGACIHIVSPSGGGTAGVTTTDLLGTGGYDNTDCTSTFSGTSSATPLVSGCIALMLEANPKLTYRDVKDILARTATKTDPTDSDWSVNGGGLNINHQYGFGRINAAAAVIMAKNFTTLPAVGTRTYNVQVNKAIPDFPGTGVTATFTVPDSFTVEHAVLAISINHPTAGDMAIKLVSPFGTTSILSFPHGSIAQLSAPAAQISATYPDINKMAFSPSAAPFAAVNGSLVLTTPAAACTALTNCAAVAGKIAIAQYAYTTCTLTTQALNAQSCGAVGLLVASPSSTVLPFAGATPDLVTIPVAMITNAIYTSATAAMQLRNVPASFRGVKIATNGYFPSWNLSSVRYWGENSAGTWTVTVADGYKGDVGTFVSANLILYGKGDNISPVTTSASSSSQTSSASSIAPIILLGMLGSLLMLLI